jgi:UDP-glucose 4-epimerase
MKILITGETGYVGNHAKEYLENTTNYVVKKVSLRRNNWMDMDFSEYDSIVHCVAVIPKNNIEDSVFFSVNHELSEKLAKKAKSDGVKQFIYLSSMAVYGMKPSTKKGEGLIYSDTPCNPDSVYGKSKYQGEQAVVSLADDNFKVAIVRSPSIYGKRSTNYFNQYYYIISKLFIQPYAFTKCKRSAIYIENLCELFRLLIKNSNHGIFCPADNPTLSTVEYIKFLQNSKGNNFYSSRLFGLALKLVCSRMPIIYSMWGSIAYDDSLTNILNGEYQIFNSYEGLNKSL